MRVRSMGERVSMIDADPNSFAQHHLEKFGSVLLEILGCRGISQKRRARGEKGAFECC